MIVALPAATPVTMPDEDTVATSALLLLQLGVTAPLVPSLKLAVAVTLVMSPTDIVVAAALTVRPVTVTSEPVTVTSAEALCPPKVAVTLAVPDAWAVTVPAVLTLATDELLDPHDAFTVALVPSL